MSTENFLSAEYTITHAMYYTLSQIDVLRV